MASVLAVGAGLAGGAVVSAVVAKKKAESEMDALFTGDDEDKIERKVQAKATRQEAKLDRIARKHEKRRAAHDQARDALRQKHGLKASSSSSTTSAARGSKGGELMCGFLEKRGGLLGTTFQRRWCVVQRATRALEYSKAQGSAPSGIIPLARAALAFERVEGEYELHVTPADGKRTYVFRGEYPNPRSRLSAWHDALRSLQ